MEVSSYETNSSRMNPCLGSCPLSSVSASPLRGLLGLISSFMRRGKDWQMSSHSRAALSRQDAEAEGTSGSSNSLCPQ